MTNPDRPVVVITDLIASRHFIHVTASGERRDFVLRIGRPTVDPEHPCTWRCPVNFPPDDRVVYIFGDDSWQALQLAMEFADIGLLGILQRGDSLLYPDSDDAYTEADFAPRRPLADTEA